MHSVEQISLNRYGVGPELRLGAAVAPAPDTSRAEITNAHNAFAAAVATGTWAWPLTVAEGEQNTAAIRKGR